MANAAFALRAAMPLPPAPPPLPPPLRPRNMFGLDMLKPSLLVSICPPTEADKIAMLAELMFELMAEFNELKLMAF